MASYIGLNSVSVTATLDTTGLNPGNYTNAFTTGVLNINVPYFECYHMVITNAPSGQSATIYVGSRQWGFTMPASQGSEWAPPNGLLLNPSQEISVCWNFNPTLIPTPPIVTCWFRYDTSIGINGTHQ